MEVHYLDDMFPKIFFILSGHAALTLRSRLRCIIMKKGEQYNDKTNDGKPQTKSKVPTNLLVLNEVVVDRGPSPYLSNIGK